LLVKKAKPFGSIILSFSLFSYRLQEAVKQGVKVVSISPSGAPIDMQHAWCKDVQWLKGDIFNPSEEVRQALGEVGGVVSCIGAFGDNAKMEVGVAALSCCLLCGPLPVCVHLSAANLLLIDSFLCLSLSCEEAVW